GAFLKRSLRMAISRPRVATPYSSSARSSGGTIMPGGGTRLTFSGMLSSGPSACATETASNMQTTAKNRIIRDLVNREWVTGRKAQGRLSLGFHGVSLTGALEHQVFGC